MLIAFCGIDGSGKSTQLKRVQAQLEQMQHKVYPTKQPTDWYRSDPRVKKLMNSEVELDDLLLRELALFSAADRLRHYQTEISIQLEKGSIVLTDRYVYSAYAYFTARGLSDIEWLKEINRFVPIPNVTVFLDVPVNIAKTRIVARDGESSHKEELNTSRMEQIRSIFLVLPVEKANFYIIDSTQDLDMVTTDIMIHITQHINRLEV